MNHRDLLLKSVKIHPGVLENPDRSSVIRQVIRNREAVAAPQGFVFTYTRPESIGRSF